MLEKLCGGVGTVFFKSLQIPKPAIFVNECVLVKLFFGRTSYKAGGRHKFHIDLHTLARVLHLLGWLGDILGIGQINRLTVDPPQQLIQS